MPPLPTAQELITLLRLAPHPEGGYYRETYRASGAIPAGALPATYEGDRRYATAILFLLPRGSCSRLHRLRSDEIWHFHLGGALHVATLAEGRRAEVLRLGPRIAAGERVQAVIPAGVWAGAYPGDGTDYALVGCTVAPGFEFADFEMGERSALLALFPHAAALIRRLTA